MKFVGTTVVYAYLQGFQLFLLVIADLFNIEAVKGFAKRISLIQDTFPGQSCLKALQDQHFK